MPARSSTGRACDSPFNQLCTLSKIDSAADAITASRTGHCRLTQPPDAKTGYWRLATGDWPLTHASDARTGYWRLTQATDARTGYWRLTQATDARVLYRCEMARGNLAQRRAAPERRRIEEDALPRCVRVRDGDR